MKGKSTRSLLVAFWPAVSVWPCGLLYGEAAKKASSYSPVVITEPFDSIVARWKAVKPEIMKRQMELLSARMILERSSCKGRDHVPR